MTSPVPPPDDPPAPRSSGALLVDRTFGPWFWGNVASNSGNWLFNVAAAVVVYDLTESALLVGLVSVAQFVPLAVLGPWAGAFTDRHDRRRALLASQAFSAIVAAILAIVTLSVGIDGLPGVWPVLAAAFGIGVGQSVATPALNALVPALVDDADLENAVALTSLTFNVGRALGPAVSGVLLATLGAGVAFGVNAASFLVLIGALLVIKERDVRAPTRGDGSVRAGLRFVRRHRPILLLLLGVGATGFAADPVITLAPALAAEFGGGDVLVAVLVSAFGVAAAPAAFIAGPLQRRFGGQRVAGGGLLVLAAGLLVAAIAPSAAVAVMGFGLTGVGFVLALNGFTTVLYRQVPDELRGRIMALWSVSFLGTRPIASVLDGLAGDAFGPRLAMTLAIAVAIGGYVVSRRLRALLP